MRYCRGYEQQVRFLITSMNVHQYINHYSRYQSHTLKQMPAFCERKNPHAHPVANTKEVIQ